MFSNFPVRVLGYDGENQPVTLTEEDRESHIHILGAPGEGKSKFIELLVRQDIGNYGACVLDPSDGGDTVNKILKYCCSIGFDKVCLVYPGDFLEFNRVPVFNPIKYNAPSAVSVGNMMDALQVLWKVKDFSETPRIDKYAKAILHALHASGLTLCDSNYFLTRTAFHSQRENILQSLPPESLHRQHLISAYQTLLTFEQFQSTVNRFSVFQDEILRLVLGSKKAGVNFSKMISEGWIILVNLDPQSVWGTEQIQQRLIGTLIINEIVHAIHRLRENGWRGAYYLYIDEIGDYATSKLAYILDKKRKTGLRFTVAHQRFNQIDDVNVLSAIRGSTKIKVLFQTPNKFDRDMMMRDMGYGGDLPDREVSYVLRQLQKQHAAISINKSNPRITRLSDIPDVEVSNQRLQDFKKHLYSYEWFHRVEEIKTEISARFKAPELATGGKRPTLTGTVEHASQPTIERQDSKRPDTRDRRTVPYDSPGRKDVLLSKKGRSTRKVTPVQTEKASGVRTRSRVRQRKGNSDQDGGVRGTEKISLSRKKQS